MQLQKQPNRLGDEDFQSAEDDCELCRKCYVSDWTVTWQEILAKEKVNMKKINDE